MTVHIAPLGIEDKARWAVLARGYKTFYKTTMSIAADAAEQQKTR